MTDIELIRLIEDDPDRGITLAIDRYGGVAKAICNNILTGYDRHEVENAWSDTFVKLWRNIGKFDEGRNASLKTYIGIMARSAALDVRRNANRFVYEELDVDNQIDVDLNMDDDYAKIQNKEVVHSAVESMNEPDRSIFILRFFYDNPIKDIAEKLALQPKQVENILYRKKEYLKSILIEGGILYD